MMVADRVRVAHKAHQLILPLMSETGRRVIRERWAEAERRDRLPPPCFILASVVSISRRLGRSCHNRQLCGSCL
jgi:hypothetical protein